MGAGASGSVDWATVKAAAQFVKQHKGADAVPPLDQVGWGRGGSPGGGLVRGPACRAARLAPAPGLDPLLHRVSLQLCRGSAIAFPQPRRREGKPPELQRRLEELRARLEQAQYDAMVADVTQVGAGHAVRQVLWVSWRAGREPAAPRACMGLRSPSPGASAPAWASRRSPELGRAISLVSLAWPRAPRLHTPLYFLQGERAAAAAREGGLATYRQQISFGVHVLAMMAAFYIFGHVLGMAATSNRALVGTLASLPARQLAWTWGAAAGAWPRLHAGRAWLPGWHAQRPAPQCVRQLGGLVHPAHVARWLISLGVVQYTQTATPTHPHPSRPHPPPCRSIPWWAWC